MMYVGFFSPPTATFIDSGNKPFHALAIALIDGFKNFSTPNDYLKKFLDCFFSYYPQLKPQQAYLTPVERMNMLLNMPRRSELVECMAYVLQQLAVNELYAHPLKYRELFNGLECTTAKSFLRKTGTIFPPAIFHPLAATLGINIILSFTDHERMLRLRKTYFNYLANTTKMVLTIQVQGEHYFPHVNNKADFAFVGHLAITPPEAVKNIHDESGTLAPMLNLIAEDNKRLHHSYRQWRKNLLTMVQSNELTTAQLLHFYIQWLPTSEGLIANPSAFFTALTDAETHPVIVKNIPNSNQQLNELLASTIAGWISINNVEADQLFDNAEKKPATSL